MGVIEDEVINRTLLQHEACKSAMDSVELKAVFTLIEKKRRKKKKGRRLSQKVQVVLV